MQITKSNFYYTKSNDFNQIVPLGKNNRLFDLNSMSMSNEVITHKHEWLRDLFSELDRIAKDTATMADENQPLLGGEHYLTDRELSERLKISRRILQDYRNNGILPYRQLGGKILYRESNIERILQSCYRGML